VVTHDAGEFVDTGQEHAQVARLPVIPSLVTRGFHVNEETSPRVGHLPLLASKPLAGHWNSNQNAET